MSRRSLCLALASFVLASCAIEIPDATYTCTATAGCPSGFVCSVGLCRRHEIDANNCTAEVCNGVDDDCDGFVDDGVLTPQVDTTIPGSDGADWNANVPDGSGGFVALAVRYESSTGENRLMATHYDSTRSVVLGPMLLTTISVSHFEASSLGGNIHVVYEETGTARLVLDQFAISDFARVGTVREIATTHDNSLYDVVDATTASGAHAFVVFGESGVVHMRTVSLPSLVIDGFQDIFTPTGTETPFEAARLAVAPCGQMLFAVLHRGSNASMARIVPMDPYGQALTPGQDVVAPGTDVVSAAADPVVLGGSCSAPPTGVALAWVQADVFGGGVTRTDVHLDVFDLAHAQADPKVTFTRSSGATITPDAGFLAMPQSIFTIESPMALGRSADGRFYLSVGVASPGFSSGRNDIYEILPDGSHATISLPRVPAISVVLDVLPLGTEPTSLVFGAGEWSDSADAHAYSLACAP